MSFNLGPIRVGVKFTSSLSICLPLKKHLQFSVHSKETSLGKIPQVSLKAHLPMFLMS